MAAYVQDTRQRLLRGMGATYSVVPRRRTLRGMGQVIAPDIGMPSFPDIPPLDFPAQPAPPPFVFTDVKPIIPAPVVTPVTPPNLGPSIPGGVQFVFPSQASVPPPPKYAAATGVPATSWFDQQMIAGVKNSYLAIATVGLVLFVSMSSAKRRR